jgi:hypothetical protein
MENKGMSFKKFLSEMCRLVLQWDGEEEVFSIPDLKRWTLVFFYFTIFGCLIILCLEQFYPRNTRFEEIYTASCRIFSLSFISLDLLLFFILLSKNYKYLMLKGKHLKLSNLLSYYLFGTFLFGKIYAGIYTINQNLFNYLNPPLQVTSVAHGGFKVFLLEMDFLLYSFLTSLSAGYYRITANHNLISLLQILQLLFTFFILSILVTLFLQSIKHQD